MESVRQIFYKTNVFAKENNIRVLISCVVKNNVRLSIFPTLGPDLHAQLSSLMLAGMRNSDIVSNNDNTLEIMDPTDKFTASISRKLRSDKSLRWTKWLILFMTADRVYNGISSLNFPMEITTKIEFCKRALELVVIKKATSELDHDVAIRQHIKSSVISHVLISNVSVFVPPPTQTFMIYTDK